MNVHKVFESSASTKPVALNKDSMVELQKTLLN